MSRQPLAEPENYLAEQSVAIIDQLILLIQAQLQFLLLFRELRLIQLIHYVQTYHPENLFVRYAPHYRRILKSVEYRFYFHLDKEELIHFPV